LQTPTSGLGEVVPGRTRSLYLENLIVLEIKTNKQTRPELNLNLNLAVKYAHNKHEVDEYTNSISLNAIDVCLFVFVHDAFNAVKIAEKSDEQASNDEHLAHSIVIISKSRLSPFAPQNTLYSSEVSVALCESGTSLEQQLLSCFECISRMTPWLLPRGC
jgi:siderophore synthetase component